MLVAATFILSSGFLFKLWISSVPYILSLININEVVSPLTSWKRVTEGLFLKRNGISPYEGDVFHQTPLLLAFLDVVEENWSNVLPGMFVIFDLIAAVLIGMAAIEIGKFMLLLQQKNRPHYHKDIEEWQLLKPKSFRSVFVYTAAVYLFNPYSVAACVAKSTAVFDHWLLASLLIFTMKGWRVSSTILLALLAYQNFYSVLLVVPVALCIVQRDQLGRVHYLAPSAIRSMLLTLSLTACWLASLLYYSHSMVGSWAFLRSTYGFILTVPELTPNMGIFWYMFTEMFAHFQLFFIIIFQLHVFIYTIPLAIKLRHHPAFLFYTLIVIIAAFKSYPSYADIGFYLSLVPCWSFAQKYRRNTFIISNIFIWTAVLSPIFYHLWIYCGSANANFYFVLNLFFNAAQIFFLTDSMYSYLRRDFDMYHISPAKPDGEKSTDGVEVDDITFK